MKKNVFYLLVAGLVVSLTAFGCGGGSSSSTPATTNPTTSSGWVSAADWDSATTVTLAMKENSDGTYAFDPSTLTFTAGQPYILKISSGVGNEEKHYFATEGAAAFVTGSDFYQAIATRKVQTVDAEYKAPYFKAIEMLVPTTTAKELEIYFVAVLPGTYAFYCSITGHEAAGMTGTITIATPSDSTSSDFALDLEVDTDYATALAADDRLSGSDDVWTTVVNLSENLTGTSSTSYSFSPATLALTKGQGYKLTLNNTSTNTDSKHYWYDEGDIGTTNPFFQNVVFRKAQDSQAEIKPYYLKAVELRDPSSADLSTDLYFVPTVSGSYENNCTVSGHKAAGMTGDIIVSDATTDASPALSSALVSAADWDSATDITLDMVENSDSTYAFDPSTLTLAAGQPYILTISSGVGNEEKHYFATEGAAAFVTGSDFYQAIATRKVQTVDAEYKAPYFKAVEMLIPSTTDKELEIYFIAQLPGTYAFYCSITGHEDAGMSGTITIEGDPTLYGLDLEVDSDYTVALSTDTRLSGSDAVWTSPTSITSDFLETSSTDYSFTSSFTSLDVGTGYKLTITNPDENGKHYWYDEGDTNTTDPLFQSVVFRKAQDSQAEIKPYYLTAVELRAASSGDLSTDLYFVPTVAGTYDHVCTVTGHEAAGMTETITVN